MNVESGYFMELQNFSVNDGSGIRTIVFFAGCPLRCQWCSNPESCTQSLKVAHYEKTCLQCGRCAVVCPNGVGIDPNKPGGREKCSSCGACEEVCPTGSRKSLIFRYTTDQILEKLEKQRIFYRYSGGGVTFSGGEATMQQHILRELVNKLYDRAVNMALETSGFFEFDEVKDILDKLDLIFVDIKHMDGSKHKEYTGVDNEKILKNISRLKELKLPVVVRIPVIAGFNGDTENIKSTARFVKANLTVPIIELLPYHSLGDGKYEALGMKKPADNFKTPSRGQLAELERIIEGEGVKIVSYR